MSSRLLLSLLLFLLSASAQSNDNQQSCDDVAGTNNDCTTTTTKIPLKLPNDFVDPCQDFNENCPQWSEEGECTNNVAYMIENCPMSCGICHPMKQKMKEGTNTVDTNHNEHGDDESSTHHWCADNNEECPIWASKGECLANQSFMHTYCKYSCWKCIRNKDRELLLGSKLDVDEASIIPMKKLLYANEINTGTAQFNCFLNNDKVWNHNHDCEMFFHQNNIDHQDQDEDDDITSIIKERIISMERYAKYLMTEPSISKKGRERCRNHHRMCAFWASRGLCVPFGYNEVLQNHHHDHQKRSNHNDNDELVLAGKESILYMMNTCPLACKMCHEITSFHKCAGKRLPWEEPLFDDDDGKEKNGRKSINSFFDQKRFTNEDWEVYQPIFLSHPIQRHTMKPDGEEASSSKDDDPYVILLQNFLSNEEADTLKSLPRSSSDGWYIRSDAISNRTLARCPSDKSCSKNETYVKIMARIASLVDAKVSHLEPIEMIRFDSSSYPHNTSPTRLEHNFEISSLWKPAGPRLLSLFIFLSDFKDDEGGGGLGFPFLDWLFIKPKKGMAVLWPNVRSDDLWLMDPMMKFEYFSGGGNHFGALSHFRLYNYTDAHLRGCV